MARHSMNLNELLAIRSINKKLYEGTVATTAVDTKDSPFQVGPFKEATFFINCSAFAGTNLNAKIVTKDPISGQWHDLVAFTQLTATGKERKAITANLGAEIAVVVTPVGEGNKTLTIGANFKIM